MGEKSEDIDTDKLISLYLCTLSITENSKIQ